jgi:hypothetical protein
MCFVTYEVEGMIKNVFCVFYIYIFTFYYYKLRG